MRLCGIGQIYTGGTSLKILQINNVYGSGSTGKLTQVLHKKLPDDGFASLVLYGRGQTVDEPGVFRVCSNFYGKVNSLFSRFSGFPYGGCIISTEKIIQQIRKEQPDVVHLQCINGSFVNIYRLVAWLKEHRIPTVLTLHAEFMYTANCGHAFDCERWKSGCGHCPRLYEATKSRFFDHTHQSFLKMERAFSGFDEKLKIVSVSPWLMERARCSPIFAGKAHTVILNGVDTTVFQRRETVELEKKHNIQDRKVIFHATAMFRDTRDDPKGGWYILQLAKQMREQPVLFLVAGKYTLSGEIPDNVILLGEIRDQALLAQYYSLADLTVLTSKRETYSMVCAESLCCGTPVVGFRAGAPEMIALPEYSCFVQNGDLVALEAQVRQWIMKKNESTSILIEEAAQTVYDKEIMIRQYEQLYRRITCSGSN